MRMMNVGYDRPGVLTLDQIAKRAPSVFAEQPWERMSEKYRFFPTIEVVEGLMKHGFAPVDARQSRSRIEGKEAFTKHVIRFRHADLLDGEGLAVGEEVPEIMLLNSHDGTSSYQLSLGMFRKVCSNGLIVKSASVADVKVRHSGRASLIDEVIEGSYQIIKEAPKATAQIEQWKGITLEPREQEILANAALEIRETSLDVPARELLRVRRFGDTGEANGERNLWKTMNVVQENIIRGGVRGLNSKNETRHLRGVNSVDGDTKFNRALWQMTEQMAKLKEAA